MSGEEIKPVVVADDVAADVAETEHGEYGVDWVYQSDVTDDAAQGDATEEKGGDDTDTTEQGTADQEEQAAQPEGGADPEQQGGDQTDSSDEEEKLSESNTTADDPASSAPEVTETQLTDDEEEPTAEEPVVDPAAGLPARVKGLYIRLQSYIKLMGPHTRPNMDLAKQQQRELYNILQDILALDDANFDAGMQMLLRTIRDNQAGAFSKRLVFRWLEQLSLSSEDLKAFMALLRLFTQTANPATRKEMLGTVDLRAVVQRLPDVRAQQRLLAFYNFEE